MYDFCKIVEKEFFAMLFLKSANWVQLEILKEFHEFKNRAQYFKKSAFLSTIISCGKLHLYTQNSEVHHKDVRTIS